MSSQHPVATILALNLLLFLEAPGIWGEDLGVESLQALLYFASGSIQLWLVFRRADGGTYGRHLHFFLFILFLVIAMEEISWGQRLFNWETPPFLSDLNLQGETNIHNIHGSVFNWVVTLFVFAFCYLVPISRIMSSRARWFMEEIGLPVVGIELVPVFMIADIFRPLDLGNLDAQLTVLASLVPLGLYLTGAAPQLFRRLKSPRLHVLSILVVGALAVLVSVIGSDVPSLWLWESRELLFGVGFLSYSAYYALTMEAR